MKLRDRTQKTITINGTRYNYKRIIRELCRTQNTAGNYWLDNSAEIIKRCRCVVIQSISGQFAIIED